MSDVEFLKKVMATLSNNPTSADLSFLVVAHTKIGYLSSVAEGEAEQAYAMRKFQEATTFTRLMTSGDKMSAAAAEKMTEVETWEYRKAELEAREKSQKIKNLLASVTEAINAIKFLGRLGA